MAGLLRGRPYTFMREAVTAFSGVLEADTHALSYRFQNWGPLNPKQALNPKQWDLGYV